MREIGRLALNVTIIGLLGRTYSIVDQIFASKISPEHLHAHVLISYIPFFATTTGIIFGYTLLVLFAKSKNDQEINQLLTGSLAVAISLIFLPFSLLHLFAKSIIVFLNLETVSGSELYLKLQVVASVFLVITTIFKYALISSKSGKTVIIADVFGNIFNMMGNWVSITFLLEPSNKFQGIVISTLLAQTVVVFIYFQLYRNRLVAHIYSSARTYLTRARSILLGEAGNMYLLYFFPLLITELLRVYGKDSQVTGYNIGYQLGYFLNMPGIALGIAGANWAAEVVNQSFACYKERISTIHKTALLFAVFPSLVLLPFVKAVSATIYGITDIFAVFSIACCIVGVALSGALVSYTCVARSVEEPKFLARIEILSSYFVGIPFL